jgi:hypothetical protein
MKDKKTQSRCTAGEPGLVRFQRGEGPCKFILLAIKMIQGDIG